MSISFSADTSGSLGKLGARGPSLLDRLERLGEEQERFLERLTQSRASGGCAACDPSRDFDEDPGVEAEETRSPSGTLEARLDRLERTQIEALLLLSVLELETKLLGRALEAAGLDLGGARGCARHRPSIAGDLSGFGCHDLDTSRLDAESAWGELEPPGSSLGSNFPNAAPGGNVEHYAGLSQNKARVNAALDQCGATREERALILAMGMQETNTLCASDRDRSKDGGAAENVSAFNLNADLVRSCGYSGPLSALNDPRNTAHVVQLMIQGMRTMGTDNFLNFVRGGRQAFEDGQAFGAGEYRGSIYACASRLLENPSLMHDDRRVANNIAHV